MSKKISNAKIVEIFQKKGCNVSSTCAALGISRKTFYKWKKDFPALAEMLSDAEEMLIDIAETALMSNIANGDNTAIIFFLKTKGKNRGYVEKQEIDTKQTVVFHEYREDRDL